LSSQSNLLPAILVVEADPDLRASLCTLLEMEGFHALASGSAEEALGILLADDLPLAVLLDGDLPCEGAAVFLERWAAGPARSVPVLALAEDEGEARTEPLSRATGQVLKPLRLEPLMGVLRRVLGRRRGREQRQRPETLELPL
jgi:DNA-binding response OmpR family regulator